MGYSFWYLLVTFLQQPRGCLRSDSENFTAFPFLRGLWDGILGSNPTLSGVSEKVPGGQAPSVKPASVGAAMVCLFGIQGLGIQVKKGLHRQLSDSVQALRCEPEEMEAQKVEWTLNVTPVQHPHGTHTKFKGSPVVS